MVFSRSSTALLLVDSLRMAILTGEILHVSLSLSLFFFFQNNTFLLFI